MGTPVLVGVGQFSERIEDDGYEALSPVAIAERAARLALGDAGIPADRVGVVACTRQFDESVPGLPSALGRPDNFPRALANRLGADTARCIYGTAGGNSPQQLVTELAGEIAAGRLGVALVTAAEAISTVLHLSGQPERPDFTEVTGVRDEDRGVGLEGILAATQVVHQLTDAPTQYAIFENARRVRLGMTRAEQAADIGRWFAPFTEVAAANPYAAVRTAATGAELTTPSGPTGANRVIADPYPKAVVAREKVNQSAAVVLTSDEVAAELGIPRSQWVYLRGHSDLHDRELTRRPDLSRSAPSVAAVRAALEMAGIGLDDVTDLDLYSCFPVAVSVVAEELGLQPEDPRRLTVTGGLPFFGGPGNGYSLHPIVEVVERCRRDPAAWGLVGANGGMLSKYSVGVYSVAPGPWVEGDDAALQAELDAPADVPVTVHPDGWATVETWTVKHQGPFPVAVVIGRTASGERFIANDFPADEEVRALLLGEDGPGARVFVRSLPEGNRVTLTEARMDELAPVPPVGLRDSYDHLDVTVGADGLLEVRITGTDDRRVLPAAAHHELAGVLDAYEADPALRVAIVTGDARGWWADEVTLPAFTIGRVLPPTGTAGLTARTLTKPVIAAVDGDLLGSAFEAALACHLLVVDEDTRLGLPQARAGLLPAAGGLVRLPRVLPRQVSMRMLLTGRPIGAAEAERWGLVARVAPRGGALESARELAADLLACAPEALERTLAILAADEAGDPDVPARTAEALDALLVTSDATEAYTATTEGRAPYWRGN
ncbi:enoyl-CoA hydratase-related protein [Marmoricola sp. RAF53]|uniref:enoyl-CoA hydratase-related protein n=1 Tax=Marmoricola sp. RAF53 TaxID=3233059 RepID=UPI003F987985